MPAEVLTDVTVEHGKRLVRQPEVVQRGVGGDDEVGADHDLQQHGVVGVCRKDLPVSFARRSTHGRSVSQML